MSETRASFARAGKFKLKRFLRFAKNTQSVLLLCKMHNVMLLLCKMHNVMLLLCKMHPAVYFDSQKRYTVQLRIKHMQTETRKNA